MSHAVFASCSGTEVKKCAHVSSLKTNLVPSCEYALFFDRPADVLKHCDVRYETSGLLEGVLSLDDNNFLASAESTSWTLVCENQMPKPIKSCKFCVLKLNCGCGIRRDTFVLPSQIPSCRGGDAEPIYLHSVNFAVLHAFHNFQNLPP